MSQIKLGVANPYIFPDPSEPAVKLETMLFSIVEPTPGKAVEYNDWYERDHQFDGGMSGEGWFSNRRWVATKRLKALRFPEDGAFDDLSIGSLCQVYWRQQGIAQSSEQWALDQWVWLNDRNRIYSDRRHFHSTSYWHLSTVAAPDERVPIELALQHPFKGMVVLMIDDNVIGDGDRTAKVSQLETVAQGGLLGSDIPLLSTWELMRKPGEPAQRPPGTLVRGKIDLLLQVAFLRGDPEDLWPHIRNYAECLEREAGVRVVFASGFIPTIPGTTAHLDEI